MDKFKFAFMPCWPSFPPEGATPKSIKKHAGTLKSHTSSQKKLGHVMIVLDLWLQAQIYLEISHRNNKQHHDYRTFYLKLKKTIHP